jgi:hypothetical protein
VTPAAASRDQLVAHPTREPKISDPLAIQALKLAAPETKLKAANAMPSSLDRRPPRNRGRDPFWHGKPLIRSQLVADHRHRSG